MTLWALLFALSTLARYHPESWVAALNPDLSRIAVPLERGLDAALSAVPLLLLVALRRGPLHVLGTSPLGTSTAPVPKPPQIGPNPP